MVLLMKMQMSVGKSFVIWTWLLIVIRPPFLHLWKRCGLRRFRLLYVVREYPIFTVDGSSPEGLGLLKTGYTSHWWLVPFNGHLNSRTQALNLERPGKRPSQIKTRGPFNHFQRLHFDVCDVSQINLRLSSSGNQAQVVGVNRPLFSSLQH